MLIVGGGAALIAIAAYLAWLSVKSLLASRRARAAERREAARQLTRRHEARAEFHHASGE